MFENNSKISFNIDHTYHSTSGNSVIFKDKEPVARKKYYSAASET